MVFSLKIIGLAFIILLLVFGLFVVLTPVALVNQTIAEQDLICHGLSEKACDLQWQCESSKGSSSCGLGACTMDISFKECRGSGLNATEITELQNNCNGLGGRFVKDETDGVYACQDRDGYRITCGDPALCHWLFEKIQQMKSN